MHRYVVSVRYSNDGRSWNMITTNVSAYSQFEAMEVAKTRVPAGYRFVEICGISESQ